MIKKMESSGNSGETVKQLDLFGKGFRGLESLSRQEQEEVGVLKSALQKYVRRGLSEKAAYMAYRLSSKKMGWNLWRRLNVIAVEDVLDATIILAVSELGRQAMKYSYESWDGRRCAVAAAILMADSQKDRRSDDFLTLTQAMGEHPDDAELKKIREDYGKVEDYVLDCHTAIGKRMRRGEEFWFKVSSETAGRTPHYEKWRSWFKPLMVRLPKEKKVKA